MKRQSNKIPKTKGEAERFLWHVVDHIRIANNGYNSDAYCLIREHIAMYFAPFNGFKARLTL